MKTAKYLALDTETGGLSQHKPSLLSLYLLALDEDFNLVDDLELRVKPDDGVYKVTAEALGINKINLVEHNDIAFTYKEARDIIRKFLNTINREGKNKLEPIGQNVAFDIQFMQQEWGLGIKSETWNKYVSYRVLDTGVIARYLQKQGKIPATVKGSLGSLVKHYDIQIEDYLLHTARWDTYACVEVLRRMLDE